MRPKSRATGVAFRRAAWASVALHAVAGCALVLFVRSLGKCEPGAPRIDTRAADEPQVRISLTDDAPISVEPLPTPKADTPPDTAKPSDTPKPPDVPTPAGPAGPFAPAVPQTLPAELVALIRKPVPTPVGSDVVEVPLPANPATPPKADPSVRPAGGTMTPTAAASNAPPTQAMHGALAAGQTVVYVLDCSGSMGAAGKFDAARAALVATLKQQPPTVRFQIICYAGTAKPLLTTDRNALPASEANVRAAVEKLAALEPRGLSDHFGAIRAALAFHPTVILMLSDGDDVSPATVKWVLSSAGQAVPVCLGRVTADGVQRVRELK